MAEIKIQWEQRVAGRMPGDIETIEESPFIAACILQRRCKVVAPAAAPIVGVFEDPASVLAQAEEKAHAAQAKLDADRAAAVDAAQAADDDAKTALAAADAALAAAEAPEPEVTPSA